MLNILSLSLVIAFKQFEYMSLTCGILLLLCISDIILTYDKLIKQIKHEDLYIMIYVYISTNAYYIYIHLVYNNYAIYIN